MMSRYNSSRSAFFGPMVILATCLATIFAMVADASDGRGDIDGDGFADLVIGAPGEDLGGYNTAGIVHLLYGTENGLDLTGAESWTPDDSGVLGSPGDDEAFGETLAVGDFNGDGMVDLAIGITGENYGTIDAAGAVHVMYGTSGGLGLAGQQVIQQGVDGLVEQAETDDYFGLALAAGDFDADGYWDLAVGTPREDLGAVVDAGCVIVLYGSSGGLLTGGSDLLSQADPNIPAMAEAYDRFGDALTVGDFNGDGYGDLAVGVYQEAIGSVARAGAVNIVYGSPSGLTTAGSQGWDQNIPGILDSSEQDDYFGSSLAAGFFNSDAYQDLAVGIPGEDVGGHSGAGAIAILLGTAGGLSAAGNEFWDQGSTGVGAIEAGDAFGRALAAGDFNGDHYTDLAIGVSGEDVGTTPDAGAINVVYGSYVGLLSSGSQLWYQGLYGVAEVPEEGDGFGFSLAAGDFNGDGWVDLAIGAPFEDSGSVTDVGIVHTLYGSSTGITDVGDQLWSQIHFGLSPEYNDFFGYSLAAIEHPLRVFSDGFESGNTSVWSATVP